jgi:hypothetical protein
MKFLSVFRHIRLVPLALLLALGAAFATAGCASSCGSHCPPIEFLVVASPNDNLNPLTASWTGDACPYPNVPACITNDVYYCWGFSIIAKQPGTCDMTITFQDRPTMTFHAEFGPGGTQGCCRGFPVIGETTVVLPYVGYDAGTDTAAGPDAGAGGGDDAANDAPPAEDAATDVTTGVD